MGPFYRMFVPKQATGANHVYFDFRVVQGSVASVGNIGFDAIFRVGRY